MSHEFLLLLPADGFDTHDSRSWHVGNVIVRASFAVAAKVILFYIAL
jgi:hypothetical protein